MTKALVFFATAMFSLSVFSAGCAGSKPTPTPANAAAASGEKCGAGTIKMTKGSTSHLNQYVVFCRPDGLPAVELTISNATADGPPATAEITMSKWREIWQLAEKAGWRTKKSDAATCVANQDGAQNMESLAISEGAKSFTSDCDGMLPADWDALWAAIGAVGPTNAVEPGVN